MKPAQSHKPHWLVMAGPIGSARATTIAAPTWFDARAYGARLFEVDPMGLTCTLDRRPLLALYEIEWRGDDYAGSRRLWSRSRGPGGNWRKWVPA